MVANTNLVKLKALEIMTALEFNWETIGAVMEYLELTNQNIYDIKIYPEIKLDAFQDERGVYSYMGIDILRKTHPKVVTGAYEWKRLYQNEWSELQDRYQEIVECGMPD